MFKKSLIAIASVALTVASYSAFAGTHCYKGEYKGEVAPCCYTYTLPPAPYVGIGLGVRNNYANTPAVFKGIDVNASLGYGGIVSPMFYLAGELFGLGTINVKDMRNNPQNVGVKSNWAIGASIIPGYMITNYVLAYLRLGINRTHFNSSNVINSNVNGWHIGLGGQTNIYQNWDLRGEYVYYAHNRSGGVRAASDVANLGLVYRFV